MEKSGKMIRISGRSCVIVVGYILALISGAAATCEKVIKPYDSNKVATMCHSSVVSGTHVYIDTDVAATTFMTSGVACTCNIQTRVGKQMKMTSVFNGTSKNCGTKAVFQFGNWSHTESYGCNIGQHNFATYMFTNMSVKLEKFGAPYDSRYCIDLNLPTCGQNQIQCESGQCLDKDWVCDNYPDCDDGTDERNCGIVDCFGSDILCDDKTQCYKMTERCNGIYECSDMSDESHKYCGELGDEPMITVTCLESEYLPTAPTATTTTPSPTTTTTEPTTTMTTTTTTRKPTTTKTTTTTSISTTTTPTPTTTKMTTEPTTTSTTTTTTTTTPTTTTTTPKPTTITTTTPPTTTTPTKSTTVTTPTTTTTTPKPTTTTPKPTTTTTTTTTTKPTTTTTTKPTTTKTTTTTPEPTTTTERTTAESITTTTTPKPTTKTTTWKPTTTITRPSTTIVPTTTKTSTQPTTTPKQTTTTPKPTTTTTTTKPTTTTTTQPTTTTPYKVECKDSEFRCNDGRLCIGLSFKCDKTNDCFDQSDELYCADESSSTDKTDVKDDEEDKKKYIIIGVVCGSLLLLILLGLIVFCIRTSRWYRSFSGRDSTRSITISEEHTDPKEELPQQYSPTHVWFPANEKSKDIFQNSPSVYIAQD